MHITFQQKKLGNPENKSKICLQNCLFWVSNLSWGQLNHPLVSENMRAFLRWSMMSKSLHQYLAHGIGLFADWSAWRILQIAMVKCHPFGALQCWLVRWPLKVSYGSYRSNASNRFFPRNMLTWQPAWKIIFWSWSWTWFDRDVYFVFFGFACMCAAGIGGCVAFAREPLSKMCTSEFQLWTFLKLESHQHRNV